jgi:high-affinity Fe2+/Pb2+ permease
MKCVIFNTSQTYRPPRSVTEIALLYFLPDDDQTDQNMQLYRKWNSIIKLILVLFIYKLLTGTLQVIPFFALSAKILYEILILP